MSVRSLLVGCLAFLALGASAAFRARQDEEKPQAVYAALYSRGSAWDAEKSLLEQPKVQEHIEHNRSLGERLLGAAPFTKDDQAPNDPAIGLVLLLAETADEASSWAEADPIVTANVMDVRVYRWNVEFVRPFPTKR